MRQYPKAPITEAIIDLRVALPSGVDVNQLNEVYKGQESAYPVIEQLHTGYGQWQFGTQVSATAGSQPVGFLSRTEDGTQVYQARLDGLTVSRLAPYQGWAIFRTEARRLWDAYRLTVKPLRIFRLAVRYVNRLDLPLPIQDFKDYLRTVPEVSLDLPQGLSGYFMQVAIPLEDIKSLALINETIIEPAAPGVLSVVLDIDVFRTQDLLLDESAIWDFFEQLHVRKNEVFEACITDRARELFQ